MIAVREKRSRKEERPVRARGKDGGTLSLAYTLGEMPSSQHRAGLAGLVVALKHLARTDRRGIARIVSVDERNASFEFDQKGMRELFDLIYAATTEESRSETPRKDQQKKVIKPIRVEAIEAKDGKGAVKKKSIYIYPQLVPRAEIALDVDPSRNGLWVKLWRDALFQILRARSTQRRPFEERAQGTFHADADEVLKTLREGGESSVSLPSTFYLGAMDRSAEDVAFRDRARFQLLLHFWPVVTGLYVPETEDRDGKRSFWGFAFAIPDIVHLAAFCEEWAPAMRMRAHDAAAFRPREAVVALGREAGLAAAWRLQQRLALTEGQRSLSDLVAGIDVIHAVKPGNAVKVLGTYRVEPTNEMVDRYGQLRGALWDYAFRRQRVENLLLDRPAWHGFGALLRTLPWERVFGKEFTHDARAELARFKHEQEDVMDETKEKAVETILLDVVSRYLAVKVKGRTGLEWAKVRDGGEQRERYDREREKSAKSAFLAVRSRTGRDFVDYFAETLCSVPQRLSNADFALLSKTLQEDPERVRTITLLALSARG